MSSLTIRVPPTNFFRSSFYTGNTSKLLRVVFQRGDFDSVKDVCNVTLVISPSVIRSKLVRRTGIEGNVMMRGGATPDALAKLGTIFKDRVVALRSFEQILNDRLNFQTETIGKW